MFCIHRWVEIPLHDLLYCSSGQIKKCLHGSTFTGSLNFNTVQKNVIVESIFCKNDVLVFGKAN